MAALQVLKKVLRGLSAVAVFGLATALAAGPIMEMYANPLDTYFGSHSFEIVAEETDEADWVYQSNFKNVQEAVNGFREFAIRESQETYVLLKNEGEALPIAKDASITLLGLRAYVPVYGNDMGAAPDKAMINAEKSHIYNAFAERGFKVNPTVLEKYKGSEQITLIEGENEIDATATFSDTAAAAELSLSDLGITSADYTGYKDAAIVVVGRPGGERKEYSVGGTDSKTGNILGLSQAEKAVIEEAKANFDKVVVLVNSTNMMELRELEEDNEIDAILWIGYPGVYGFYGVADVLNGTVSPSAHLGDTYAANTAVNPAMVSYGTDGKNKWSNVDEFGGNDNTNSFLINQEGIYTGYRYYETRYADVVAGVDGAAEADAGTYVNADSTVATADGTWNYANEVVYPFGYGLSYTEFEQTLDSVRIKGDKKTAEVTVTVENIGNTAGKSVIQLYAQAPYTEYDRANGVEKSAIQLMDYEKTRTLEKGDKQTITLHVDMANLASYDYTNAKTYIVDDGEYYFAIGDDAHDALNNILAAQGYTSEDGMVGTGDSAKAHRWTWSGSANGVDAQTFSVSKAEVEITNRLSDGDSSMDINSFDGYANTAKYMTRADWNGTYPEPIRDLEAKGRLATLLRNDFIEVSTSDDVSAYSWGVDKGITIYEMKGAEWNDPRWDDFIDQIPISEFLSFAQSAFHNIAGIESIGYPGNAADDGPGGSDSGKMSTHGQYQGVMYTDMEGYDTKYDSYGTRIAPTPTNLAYSWNKELAYENGEIILGESTLVFNLPIMIGPGMNLHRHAYNGRGGEYYSEDPILSGFTGSAVTQGAQSKGCIVNIKHYAFNDQEGDRSGIAVFMNEQTAREMELRNFQQAFEAGGKPASFYEDESKSDEYTVGALGVMTSFNRIGATAPSANKGACVDILRDEWDFNGYSVTDFTGVAPKAAPKESILYNTTAFCGFGVSVDYWEDEYFAHDADMCAAIKANLKYILYPLVNSAAMNGQNITSHRVELDTPWRALYRNMQIGFGVATGVLIAGWIALEIVGAVQKKKEVR